MTHSYETHPLVGSHPTNEFTVRIDDARLKRVTRLRLLADPSAFFPHWDISYCYGVLYNGTHVRVSLPGHWLFDRKKPLRPQIVTFCQQSNVYGKGLGLLDEGTLSVFVA